MARRGLVALGMAGALALSLAACGGDSGSDDSGGGDTLVFGSSADPVILDGAYVSDGESLRAIRQIFEGLVDTAPGSTDIVPKLAESYDASDDGKVWTFKLKEGVKFQDGTDFNAEAVCANFERWYNFTGLQQADTVSYYYLTVFGGFKNNESDSLGESLYSSCKAVDDATAEVTLTRASSTFLSALSLPSFAMASPEALEKYGANDVGGTADSPTFTGTFGTENPIGTGPYKLDEWIKGDKLVLVRNDDYWGEKAQIETVILKPIADGPARRQALEAGDIDGYDLVDPSDIDALKEAGYQLLNRPAFNVAYVGFNQAIKPLEDVRVRQALAHAINRENVITTKYPEGSNVATQFQPPEVFGYADDVTKYEYDPEKAKSLLAAAGQSNLTLEFWYPSGVSRPYMPDPAANFQLMKADLEAVGITVVPKTAPWNPDYLDAVDGGSAAIYLLGWTGDFGDPDNFIGTFFQAPLKQWGFDNPALFAALDAAEAEPDQAKRETLYQDINRQIMDFLPGLPYAHTEPTLAFEDNVEGFVPSPVTNEDFSTVSFS
jgi:peptide/nickel transport system substrate-binding protein